MAMNELAALFHWRVAWGGTAAAGTACIICLYHGFRRPFLAEVRSRQRAIAASSPCPPLIQRHGCPGRAHGVSAWCCTSLSPRIMKTSNSSSA